MITAFAVSAAALLTVHAQGSPQQYVLSADAVKFTPLDPSNPAGPRVSVVSGELQGKGPVTLFLKLPKGAAPIHTHTAGYYGVLVSGQAKHWKAGEEAGAKALGPGSHWYQPGKAPHGDECLSSECLLLLQMDGPYDYAPVTR
jgi:hypothetical protein